MKKAILFSLTCLLASTINAQSIYTIPELVVLSSGMKVSNIIMQVAIDRNGFAVPGALRFKLSFWSSKTAKDEGAGQIYPALISNVSASDSVPVAYFKVDRNSKISRCDVHFTATDTISIEPPFIVADIYLFASEQLAKELKNKYNWTLK